MMLKGFKVSLKDIECCISDFVMPKGDGQIYTESGFGDDCFAGDVSICDEGALVCFSSNVHEVNDHLRDRYAAVSAVKVIQANQDLVLVHVIARVPPLINALSIFIGWRGVRSWVSEPQGDGVSLSPMRFRNTTSPDSTELRLLAQMI